MWPEVEIMVGWNNNVLKNGLKQPQNHRVHPLNLKTTNLAGKRNKMDIKERNYQTPMLYCDSTREEHIICIE